MYPERWWWRRRKNWPEIRLRHRQEDNIKIDLRVIKTELTCDRILDNSDDDDDPDPDAS
jgi:hypothetical protein